MALLTRNALKNFFKSGSLPSEVNFSDLIDSTVNKVDDGFGKSNADGLQLAPKGNSNKVISFFDNVKDKSPSFSMSLSDDNLTKGISFNDSRNEPCMFLKDGGDVGFGTNRPQHKLDVHGVVSMKGRVGTYQQGNIPADGNWHDVITGLDACQAFEIVAKAKGKVGRGKYAMTHAIAISTFGKSRSKINQTSACFGWFWNRIKLRWRGDIHNFRLQMKTGSHYGLDDNEVPYMIEYNVSSLWPESKQENTASTNSIIKKEKRVAVTADSLDL